MKFEDGKKYKFSREKYIQDRGEQRYWINKSWVDRSDGREVIVRSCVDAVIGSGGPRYLVDVSWCEEVE